MGVISGLFWPKTIISMCACVVLVWRKTDSTQQNEEINSAKTFIPLFFPKISFPQLPGHPVGFFPHPVGFDVGIRMLLLSFFLLYCGSALSMA